MIELCQDVEMQYEDVKQKERSIRSVTQSAVDKLRADEKYNDEKIKKTIREKNAIMGIQNDEEGSIEPSD